METIRFIAANGEQYSGHIVYRENKDSVRVCLDRKYVSTRWTTSVSISNDGNLVMNKLVECPGGTHETTALTVHREDIPRFKMACDQVTRPTPWSDRVEG